MEDGGRIWPENLLYVGPGAALESLRTYLRGAALRAQEGHKACYMGATPKILERAIFPGAMQIVLACPECSSVSVARTLKDIP
jgi:hypothetical protein